MSNYQALPSSSSLVGRDRELAELRAYLGIALDGGATPLLVVGEEGIGKSRLLSELLTSPQAANCATLRATCLRPDLHEPYALVRTITRAAGAHLSDDILDQPTTGDRHHTRRIEQALRAALEAAAPSRWLILVAEDIHWSDQASLEVLLALIQQPGHLVLACTYRPEPTSPALSSFLSELDRLRLARETRLAPLGRSGVARLVSTALDQPPSLPPGLLDLMMDSTGGNPFLIEELLRSLIETGSLTQADARWSYHPGARTPVPLSLRRSVEVRLRSLGPDAAQIAIFLAALGQITSTALLGRVTRLPVDRLLAAVRALVGAQILAQQDDGRFTFRHALMGDAVLADLLEPERQDLHRRLVQALSDEPGVPASVLAYHWARAGEPATAAPFALQAAERAAALNAHREAIGHYELANAGCDGADARILSALGRHHAALGEFEPAIEYFGRARELGVAAENSVAAAELDLQIGVANLRLQRCDAAMAHLNSALAGLPPHHPDRWQAALWIGRRLSGRGEFARAEATFGQALAGLESDQPMARLTICFEKGLARARQGDWQALVEASGAVLTAEAGASVDSAALLHAAHSSLADVACQQGQFGPASDHLLAAIELASQHGLMPEHMQARFQLASSVLFSTGRWREALAEFAEVQAFAPAPLAESARAFELWLDGSWEQAAIASQDEWRRAEDGDDISVIQETACRLADVLLALGRPQQALGVAREALARVRPVGARTFEAQLVPRALAALARLGDPGFGQACEAGLALARELGAGPVAAMIVRSRALAHRAEGRWSDAFEDSDAAAGAFAGMAMLYEAAVTLREAGLIRLARGRRGDREKATEYLERGRQLFAEIGDQRDVVATDRTLSAAGLAVLPGRGPGRLSAREVDVAELVARGLSNREIASQLYIAEKTVAHHVGAILFKLGFNSRAEIAAYVARGELRRSELL